MQNMCYIDVIDVFIICFLNGLTLKYNNKLKIELKCHPFEVVSRHTNSYYKWFEII